MKETLNWCCRTVVIVSIDFIKHNPTGVSLYHDPLMSMKQNVLKSFFQLAVLVG